MRSQSAAALQTAGGNMGSISHRARSAATQMVVEEAFDELRDAFFERLRGERLDLAALDVALRPGKDRRASIYEELAARAHRLHGRAEIFEISQVADAANTLEQAAIYASMSHTVRQVIPVRAALAALVRTIATVEATSAHESVATPG